MNRIVIPVASFATGVFVGIVLALVLAPNSGEELRSEVRLRAENQWSDLTQALQEMRRTTAMLEGSNAEVGAMENPNR